MNRRFDTVFNVYKCNIKSLFSLWYNRSKRVSEARGQGWARGRCLATIDFGEMTRTEPVLRVTQVSGAACSCAMQPGPTLLLVG